MYSEAFEKCFDKTLKHEGGYYNNPKDTGGQTMYGIAYNYNKEFYASIGITSPEEVKNLTIDQAKQRYYDGYYVPAKCALFESYPEFCQSYFDMVLHQGIGGAVRCLQSMLNQVLVETQLKIDGGFGIKTQAAASQVFGGKWPDNGFNDGNLTQMFNATRVQYYTARFRDPKDSWFKNYRFLNSGLRRLI